MSADTSALYQARQRLATLRRILTDMNSLGYDALPIDQEIKTLAATEIEVPVLCILCHDWISYFVLPDYPGWPSCGLCGKCDRKMSEKSGLRPSAPVVMVLA